MALFEDLVVPNILGADLYRARPAYVAAIALQLQVFHDFGASKGKTVQIDRNVFWGEQGMTKTGRQRNKTQTIGTGNAMGLQKTTRLVTLYEATGPDNGGPGCLQITYEDMMLARKMLYDFGNMMGFHQSIGSEMLADDYQRWTDRVQLLELGNTTNKYNPGGVADGSTTGNSKFDVQTDLLTIVERLQVNNTNRFPDGTYHALVSIRMEKHLNQDSDFRSTQRAVLQGGANPMMNPLMTGGAVSQVTPSGMPIYSPPQPVVYAGVSFWPTNNIQTRTVNSLTAFLGFFFGPQTVGKASGGPMGQVQVARDTNTDYNRVFSFIWKEFSEYTYLLDDNANSGICVEARTFAA